MFKKYFKKPKDIKKTYKVYETIGIIANIISLSSYIPITIDVFTQPNQYLVSITYVIYGLYIGSNIFYLLYGIGHQSWSLIITSLITISISAILLIQITFFYKRKKNLSS